jgi:hypothetical protein
MVISPNGRRKKREASLEASSALTAISKYLNINIQNKDSPQEQRWDFGISKYGRMGSAAN